MSASKTANKSFFNGYIRVYGPSFKDHVVVASRIEIDVPSDPMSTLVASKFGIAILNAVECARELDHTAGIHSS